MKEKITESLHDPEALERLYRTDPSGFSAAFPDAAGENTSDLVNFWRIRLLKDLTFTPEKRDKKSTWYTVFIAVALALLTWAPVHLFGAGIENYLIRNFPALVFAGLIAWFILKNRLSGFKNLLPLALPVLILVVFLNLLPGETSDTSVLAFIHAPLLMWFLFAFTLLGCGLREHARLSRFIRFNGELATMAGLILIGFFILSGLTISLFFLLGKQIGKFYIENIFIVGLAVTPVVAAYLTDLYPDMTSRIAPLIARIFAPLALLASVLYLIALVWSGINISENRDILITFNLLLIAVMAIILFSLSDSENLKIRKVQIIILLMLTSVTLIIDLFALHAIITRLAGGITPNRAVVLLSNLLILIHLSLLMPGLYRAGFKGETTASAVKMTAHYLPVYVAYILLIIFVFPFIFGFR